MEFRFDTKMLSRFAKAVFVATSLAPVLCGYGIVEWSDGRPLAETWFWFVMTAGLVVIAYSMPMVARRRLAARQVNVQSVKDSDKETLTFLITYLLPLAGKTTFDVRVHPLAVVYVFALIFWTVWHTNSFTFNPLLGLFGYHFYEIETDAKMKYLLISKTSFRKQSIEPWLIQLTDYVYLEGKRPAWLVEEKESPTSS